MRIAGGASGKMKLIGYAYQKVIAMPVNGCKAPNPIEAAGRVLMLKFSPHPHSESLVS